MGSPSRFHRQLHQTCEKFDGLIEALKQNPIAVNQPLTLLVILSYQRDKLDGLFGVDESDHQCTLGYHASLTTTLCYNACKSYCAPLLQSMIYIDEIQV